MAEQTEGEQDQSKRPSALNGVLAAALTLAVSYIAARSVPGGNQSGDNTEANQQIAEWTAAVALHTKKVAIWTFCLVAVGIVTAVVLAIQGCILYRTDEAGRITNRAYVFLQEIQLISNSANGEIAWAIAPEWVNGGNTTTRDMTMRISAWGADNSADYVEGFTRCDVGAAKTVPVVLGPRQTSTIPFVNFAPDVFQAIQNGAARLFFIWGLAEYRDQFSNERRITRFCFDVKRLNGNPIDANSKLKLLYGLCTEGNCADDDCKKEDDRLKSKMAAVKTFCETTNKAFSNNQNPPK